MKNIALFNSFPYHFEVMGSFIHYCQQRKYSLFIFTETRENYGWLDFYMMLFAQSNYFFTILPYKDLNSDMISMMDKFYITTDDDLFIPHELLSQPHKCIYLCHYAERMNPLKSFIPILPFGGKEMDFVLPVFPGFKPSFLTPSRSPSPSPIKVWNILLIGTTSYQMEEIDQLITGTKTVNKIKLHWINRKKPFKIPPNTFFYEKASTFTIVHLCKKCDFIYHPQKVKEILEAKKISGAMIIGLSFQIPLILPLMYQSLFALESPLYLQHDSPLLSQLENYKKDTMLLEKDLGKLLQWNQQILDKYFDFNILHSPSPSASLEIFSKNVNPRIHFVWFDKKNPKTLNYDFPIQYQHMVQSFQFHNPWANIKIWNYQDVVNLVEDQPEMRKYLEFMETLPSNQQKCDIGRLVIVYLLGGLYMDMDFWCMKDISAVFENKEIIFSYEPDEHILPKMKIKKLVCNSLFYSRDEKSPIIKAWLDYILFQYPKNIYGSRGDAFWSVGPMVLTQFLYHPENHHLLDFVLPSHYFIPVTDKCIFSLEKQTLGKEEPVYTFTRWIDGTGHGKKRMLLYNPQKNKENFGIYIQSPDDFLKSANNLYIDKNPPEKSSSCPTSTYLLVLVILLLILFLLFLWQALVVIRS